MMPVDQDFLWDVWDELTDEETPPFYLAPYAAPVLLLHETINISNLALKHERWRKRLREVLQEARTAWSKLDNQVDSSRHPWLKPRLAFDVMEALPRNDSALTDTDIRECYHRVRRLVLHVPDPVENLLNELDSLGPKNKRDATRILGWVVAELGWRGWTSSQLEMLESDSTIEDVRGDLTASIRRSFSQRVVARTCSLGVYAPATRLSQWLKLNDVTVRNPTDTERVFYNDPPNSDDFSVVDWPSSDAANDAVASRRSHELLGRALVMANVLGAPALRSVEISSKIMVSLQGASSSNEPRIVDIDEDYSGWAQAPDRFTGALGDFLENHLDLRALDPDLENALDRYRSAIDEHHLRDRFLGMWSTLEGMSSVIGGGEVLGRVEALVVPAVLGGHFHSLLEHTRRNHHNAGLYPPTSGVLFQILTDPDTTRLEELFSECAHASIPLEIFRLSQLRDSLCSRKSMMKMLEVEQERVKVQLARMYRARNLLVHSNQRYPSLTRLSHEIQHYTRLVLAGAISRLPHAKTLEGALYDCRDRVRWLQRLLRGDDEVRASDAGVIGNQVIYPGSATR